MEKAARRNKKERALGGMLVGIRVGIKAIQKEMGLVGIIVVGFGQERCRIVGVYVNGDMDKKLR